MIVVDGSALFAILLGEPLGADCRDAIERDFELLMAAPSLTEFLVVATGKRVLDEALAFVDALRPTIIALTEARARSAAEAYRRFGKGRHPANLNICDTFAYALATEYNAPLLFVGNDFALTDIKRALPAS